MSVDKIALFENYVVVYCFDVETLLIRIANLRSIKSVIDVNFVQ